MTLLIVSFFAWILTVLAPCVLPILPIILGAWIDNNHKSRPYIIILSLSISIIIFSLLLKATTIFIWVDIKYLTILSWWIIFIFWIFTLFPDLWKNFSTRIWFTWKSNEKLWKHWQKKWIIWSILIWFSLWPVFSSCSPTYAVILAVILPVSFLTWLLNLFAYSLWLAFVLLLIVFLEQKIVKKLKFVSDPKWWFKKVLGVLFILVWLAIIFWIDKKIETSILKSWYFWALDFEQSILDKVEIEKSIEPSSSKEKQDSNLTSSFIWDKKEQKKIF